MKTRLLMISWMYTYGKCIGKPGQIMYTLDRAHRVLDQRVLLMDGYIDYRNWTKEVVDSHLQHCKKIKNGKDDIKEEQLNDLKRREVDLIRKEEIMRKKILILRGKQRKFRKREEEMVELQKSMSRDPIYPPLNLKKYFEPDSKLITYQQITESAVNFRDSQIAQEQQYFENRLQISRVLDVKIPNKSTQSKSRLCSIQ